MNLSRGVKLLGRFIKVNSPTILTGIAVGGLITTVILAVKATPKAMADIQDATFMKNKDFPKEDFIPLTKLEVIKATWKGYIPTAVMGAMTVSCVIGANSINLKRHALLAGAYSLTEVAMKEYQHKVVETIGEKKEQAIRDSIMEDRMKNNPRVEGNMIIVGGGETDFYDSFSGRYFKHDIEKVRRAVNEFNRVLLKDNWSSINELYSLWGLEAIKGGENVGWNSDKLVEISFSAIIDPKTERPCLGIDYIDGPKEDYFRRPQFR